MFVHRLRVIEGKDGNPLNEVRVLCNSILLNGGKMQVETLPEWPMPGGRSLKLPLEKSVLKLKVGDVVKLSEADFVRLSKAFFAALEEKYLQLQATDGPPRMPFRHPGTDVVSLSHGITCCKIGSSGVIGGCDSASVLVSVGATSLDRDENFGLLPMRVAGHGLLIFRSVPCGNSFLDVGESLLFVFPMRHASGQGRAFNYKPAIFRLVERHVKDRTDILIAIGRYNAGCIAIIRK
jgi:hypothetical protein